ncbi:leucine-rich repeat and guanylate kinase domain-containing protein-like [Leucoraja erinacea]|uniref:leucine-rich repeat and guanylate kinase domain-containing protein-like n=1 Tax=Leucoraja erinaceus TaxID=7782 RepID=UPI002456BA5F|nr:leucine-rich repeat and guanylate kinase domain-containing protein-like [Leucoraja erinacea]
MMARPNEQGNGRFLNGHSWIMEAPAGNESDVAEVEEEEEAEGLEMVWELVEEVAREWAGDAVDEAVEEAAVEGMFIDMLDDGTRELAQEFLQELLANALSSSDSSSTGECEELVEDEEEVSCRAGQKPAINLPRANRSQKINSSNLDVLVTYVHNNELSDISILCNYIHLQKLELPNNKITDLRCVSYMPYLLKLDASHNALNSLTGLKLPKNIEEVDLSFNKISDMKELSGYPFLSKLNLDNNRIQAIAGLQNCRSLSFLSMIKNRLLEIDCLDHLPIKFLSLRGNQLVNVKGLVNLKRLHKLDLLENNIETLIGLEDHDLLETINLDNNQISDLDEIMHLRNLPLLRDLNLLHNPIQKNPDYLLWTLFVIQKLTTLDNKKVKVTDKVLAMNKYNPPPEVVAANDHMTNIMYRFLQTQRIYDSTLPNFDIPYPMLVLVGPQGSGKRKLCQMLCHEFHEYFGYCISHTSRTPYNGEENGKEYQFVSNENFEEMIQMGKFIETVKQDGCYFGLSRDALETVASRGLACCIHMGLEGVRSLKMTYFEPRYILLIPNNKEEHEKRLRFRGVLNESQINRALSKVDNYISINQEFPGYFDAVINSDELTDAYAELSKLIKEYLSLNVPKCDESTKSLDDERWQMSNLMTTIPSSENEQNWSSISWATGYPPEFVDSSTRNYSSRVQARLSAQKSALEQDSIEQRRMIAREAVKGISRNINTYLFKRVRDFNFLKSEVSVWTSGTSILPFASTSVQDVEPGSISRSASSEMTQISNGESSPLSPDLYAAKSSSIETDSDSSVQLNNEMMQNMEMNLLSDLQITLKGTRGLVDRDKAGTAESPNDVQLLSKKLFAKTNEPITLRLGFNVKPVLPGIPSGRTTAEIPVHPEPAICPLK